MTTVLLTSQQPIEALGLAVAWARNGDQVTVVLLDSATAVLRAGHRAADGLQAARDAGARVLAHHDAVIERAIAAPDVELVDLERVADLVADEQSRVQWW